MSLEAGFERRKPGLFLLCSLCFTLAIQDMRPQLLLRGLMPPHRDELSSLWNCKSKETLLLICLIVLAPDVAECALRPPVAHPTLL